MEGCVSFFDNIYCGFYDYERSLFYSVLFYVWFALVFNHFNSTRTFLSCQDFSHLDFFFPHRNQILFYF